MQAVVVTVGVLLRDPVTVAVMVLVDDDEIDTVIDVESDDVKLIITLVDDKTVAEIERVTLSVSDVDGLCDSDWGDDGDDDTVVEDDNDSRDEAEDDTQTDPVNVGEVE